MRDKMPVRVGAAVTLPKGFADSSEFWTTFVYKSSRMPAKGKIESHREERREAERLMSVGKTKMWGLPLAPNAVYEGAPFGVTEMEGFRYNYQMLAEVKTAKISHTSIHLGADGGSGKSKQQREVVKVEKGIRGECMAAVAAIVSAYQWRWRIIRGMKMRWSEEETCPLARKAIVVRIHKGARGNFCPSL